MFKELLEKLHEHNYIVTLEFEQCVIKDKIEGIEVMAISNIDKDRDIKLRDCYYNLIA